MKKNYLLLPVLALFLLSFSNAKAQMYGSTSTFLKGHYIELGIGKLGYFGSDTAAPPGYHPHCVTGFGAPNGIGFVADPSTTGWSTGSGSHYWGDYFLPGAPYEGWILQVNGKRCQAFNFGPTGTSGSGGTPETFRYGGGMGPCTGDNIAYSTLGSKVMATWQGTADSITITQVTTLDTNDMFFTVKVTLTNTAVAPKNNIYYLRSIDPDNDQQWPSGDFTTNNLIEHQMPGSFGASVVSASGLSSASSYMAFGTTDTASRAMIYTGIIISEMTDISSIYSEVFNPPAYYAEGITHSGDLGIALIMNIPHLATVDSAGDSVYRTTAGSTLHPANSASFSYFYAFSTGAVGTAITYLNGTTTGVNNVNTGTDIKVYPNPSKDVLNVTSLSVTDRISLYDMMGREVTHNWIISQDGTNAFRYDGVPAGAYILVVTDANGHVKTKAPIRKQ